MYDREKVRQYHKEHGAEFRLKCMIGAAKGKARSAKTKEEADKYTQEAERLTKELEELKI